MNKCLVTKDRKFLWWKWVDKYYNHDFQYWEEDNLEKRFRRCSKCHHVEILWRIERQNGWEDWREFYDE